MVAVPVASEAPPPSGTARRSASARSPLLKRCRRSSRYSRCFSGVAGVEKKLRKAVANQPGCSARAGGGGSRGGGGGVVGVSQVPRRSSKPDWRGEVGAAGRAWEPNQVFTRSNHDGSRGVGGGRRSSSTSSSRRADRSCGVLGRRVASEAKKPPSRAPRLGLGGRAARAVNQAPSLARRVGLTGCGTIVCGGACVDSAASMGAKTASRFGAAARWLTTTGCGGGASSSTSSTAGSSSSINSEG